MRGADTLAVLLLSALVALAVVAGAALVEAGYFSPWGLALVVLVGVGFVGFAPAHIHHQGPHNAQVHGAARIADESEAVEAARGNSGARKLDEHHFEN